MKSIARQDCDAVKVMEVSPRGAVRVTRSLTRVVANEDGLDRHPPLSRPGAPFQLIAGIESGTESSNVVT
ncbi:hypothetical protein AOC05_00605 [Arthrobacter alpinus]|uniref:Uncharacterized protein n=1 Tax=Arthrobacter alpinus TaxID=656366 RepID=A0A0M3UFE8_9MICC|nr:hypothetical protein AOC05_00605 [Arthrobacter alpinus]